LENLVLLYKALLFLSVPPVEAVILDEKGVVAGEVVTGYHQGSTLVLTCDIIGGNHFPDPSRPLFVCELVKLNGGPCHSFDIFCKTVCFMILTL
jgi:hypothetical protein